MFCKHCGSPLPDGTEKCTLCGAILVQRPAPVPKDMIDDFSTTQIPAVSPEKDVPPVEDVWQTAVLPETPPAHFAPEPEDVEDIRSFSGYHRPYAQPEETLYAEQDFLYEEEQKPRRPKKKWIWIAAPVAALVLCIGIFLLVQQNTPIQQLKRAMDTHAYTTVMQMLPQLERKEQQEAQPLLLEFAQDAVQRFNVGEDDYNTVYELVDRVLHLYNTAEMKSVLTSLEELWASKEAYNKAQAAEYTAKLTEALKYYGQVLPTDVCYGDAKQRIDALKDSYKTDILAEVDGYLSAKDYQNALACLLTAEGVLANDPDIQSKREMVEKTEHTDYVESLLKSAKELADSGNFLGAIELLRGATREDETITQQIETYHDRYRMVQMQRAESEAGTGDYENAIQTMQALLEYLGEDSEVSQKIQEYKTKLPIALVKMTPVSGPNCAASWSATDIYGNRYDSGLSFQLNGNNTEINTTYLADGRFRLLSGKWIVETSSSSDFSGRVAIYVDGELKYEMGGLTPGSYALDIDLVLNYAKTVRITASGNFGSANSSGYMYFAEATLHN